MATNLEGAAHAWGKGLGALGESGSELAVGKTWEVVYLKPSELYVARQPTIITTLLGSCVAVCIYLPRSRIGAISHSLLPNNPGGEEMPFRYVDSSIEYLIDQLRLAELPPREVIVKLFGGAEVVAGSGPGARQPSIGAKNVAVARQALRSYGLPIHAELVGGRQGYKLHFYSNTGMVKLKRLGGGGGGGVDGQ